jgi:hypothetical protein
MTRALRRACAHDRTRPQDDARARGSSIEQLALRKHEAAAALGVSDETFDRYVRPSLPVVRLGSVRVYPIDALERWLFEHQEAPAEELERLAS